LRNGEKVTEGRPEDRNAKIERGEERRKKKGPVHPKNGELSKNNQGMAQGFEEEREL